MESGPACIGRRTRILTTLRQGQRKFRIRKVSLTTTVLVGSVRTVLFSVTEQSSFYAVSVTASEEAVLTQRFVCEQQRFHLAFLVLQLAVLHRILPVASLFVDVEVESGRTTDGLKSLQFVAMEKSS